MRVHEQESLEVESVVSGRWSLVHGGVGSFHMQMNHLGLIEWFKRLITHEVYVNSRLNSLSDLLLRFVIILLSFSLSFYLSMYRPISL